MALSEWLAGTTARAIGPGIAYYIETQRDRLAQTAVPLPDVSKLRLRQYFSDANLDRVRILQTHPLPIPDPPFHSVLRWLRMDVPQPSLVEAITFGHVIAARETMGLPLLFHDMVHTVQYRMLGVNRFSRLYVRGFFGAGGYHAIPLERCAFELEQRFVAAPEPFDVEAQVSKWIDGDLF
jgi:hypothetical protein